MAILDRQNLIPGARELIKLARSDRSAAGKVMAELTLEEQVAAVCEAPLSLRASILDLAPHPEHVVPLLPEAELCFLCKYVGVSDAAWLLSLATTTQITACLDLDAWRGLSPDRNSLDAWLASLAEAGDETLARAAQSMDPEILALYLRYHVRVELKPSGDEDWQPPEGGQTLEGQFYFMARAEGDDLAPLMRLLHVLFQKDYWLYFRMMQSVTEELEPEIVEWALRWRTGRLEDLGFPSWDSSMRIYGFLRSNHLSDVPIEFEPLTLSEWALPVWISDLPAAADSNHSLFRAVTELDADERQAFFYAFIALANKVAVADRRPLGDADTLPDTIEKAASVTSVGLDHVASQNGLAPVEALRRASLERLFRVGVNLAPEGVRPSLSDAEEDSSDEPGEDGDLPANDAS
jgi:hypothetical protein